MEKVQRGAVPGMKLTGLDRYLWTAVEEHRELGSLRTAYRDSGTEEKLSAEVILIHDDEAYAALEDAASSHLLDTGRRSGVLLLRCGENREEFVVSLWPTQVPSVRLLVSTLSPTDDRWERALRWVRRASPHMSRYYLNQRSLLDLVSGLDEFGEVRIGRLSARKYEDASVYNRSWAASKNIPQPSLLEVLAEIRNVAAITKLQVSAGNQLTVHLRRFAGATFHSGDFAAFDRVVLSPLAEAAGERLALLQGRARKEETELPLPVVVRSSESVFNDLDFRRSIVDKIGDLSHTGIAVLHGNPYVHIAVTDYEDGSNFDAFVTDPNELKIYPGYRASPASIARFTDSVASLIGAAEIGEGSEVKRPTLDDLLSDG